MNNLSNIISKLNSNIVYNVHVGNINIAITDSMISMWCVMAVIIILAIFFTARMRQVPGKRQSLVESFVDLISGILKDSLPDHVEHFIPFIGTMLIFIVFANIVDIINIIIPMDIAPPTKDINIVLALSLISIFSVIYAGIKFRRFKGWLKSFTEPIPLILPFKILDYFIKPLSLTLRLFGNIVAGFLIMTLIYTFIPGILPSLASIYFDLFDGALQAYIFVFLTSLYIGEAIEQDE